MQTVPVLGGFILAVLMVQAAILVLNLLYWRKRRLGRAGECDGNLPTLSVLIPARNERENLPRLLESLAPQRMGDSV
ncbi:MAG: hypothetical protein SNJ72_10770, partial [Fimbriimonadales bacterium]